MTLPDSPKICKCTNESLDTKPPFSDSKLPRRMVIGDAREFNNYFAIRQLKQRKECENMDTLMGARGEIYLEPDETPDTGDVGTETSNPEPAE